eukprot:3637236-Pyramimonas_sp.AAC.1
MAHRFTRVHPLQEVLDQTTRASPHQLVQREMEKWQKIWAAHGLTQCARPPDFDDWDLLPEMSVAMLRAVFLKFKAKTAVGQSGIAP